MIQKKYFHLILSIIFLIVIFSSFATGAVVNDYTLRCSEFVWCHGSAHCGGSGWQEDVCEIHCLAGGIILCPLNYYY